MVMTRMVITIGVGQLGRVVLERHGATAAADAVALAGAAGDPAAEVVIEWYDHHGVESSELDGRSTATIGRGVARSRAVADGELSVAPAVVAIVARAEQLLGRPLDSAAIDGVSVTFAEPAASRFATVAADLRMCLAEVTGNHRRFVLC